MTRAPSDDAGVVRREVLTEVGDRVGERLPRAQPRGEHDGGRLAQVVGVGLEGETEERDVLAAQTAPQPLLELADHPPLLQMVDLDDGVQELEVITGVAGELLERLDVFGKARAAVADAGLQEVRPDAVIETHAVGHGAHVGAHHLAHVGDLVDERDLGGQEGVGGVLDHLRRGHVGAYNHSVDTAVELLDRVAVLYRGRADDDAVGLQEVLNSGALAQELGIGYIGDFTLEPCRLEVGDDALARAHGHGALHHEQTPSAALRDLVRGIQHAREVGVAGQRGRRVDGDIQRVTGCEQLVVRSRERETDRVVLDELVEAGFVDGDRATAQALDLGRVDVHAHHVVTKMGKADRGHEAHVARADDADWRPSLRH